ALRLEFPNRSVHAHECLLRQILAVRARERDAQRVHAVLIRAHERTEGIGVAPPAPLQGRSVELDHFSPTHDRPRQKFRQLRYTETCFRLIRRSRGYVKEIKGMCRTCAASMRSRAA